MTEARFAEVHDWVKQTGNSKILHNAEVSEQFAKYYLEIFHESICTTCPGKLSEAIFHLLNYSFQKLTIMANQKYSVKNGGIIDTVYSPIAGVPMHVTSANLTNEVAELLLKNPNYKNQLVVNAGSKEVAPDAPAASKAPAETEPKDRAAEISEMTVAEIKTKLDKLKVDYTAGTKKDELAQLLADNETAKK